MTPLTFAHDARATLHSPKLHSYRLRMSRSVAVAERQVELGQAHRSKRDSDRHEAAVSGLPVTGHKHKTFHFAGQAQHPSQYPLSALQALQEVDLAQTRSIALPFAGKVHLQTHLQLTATPVLSLQENMGVSIPAAAPQSCSSSPIPFTSSALSSTPPPRSITPSTVECYTSTCSDSSSEFSLTAAICTDSAGEKPEWPSERPRTGIQARSRDGNRSLCPPLSHFSSCSEEANLAPGMERPNCKVERAKAGLDNMCDRDVLQETPSAFMLPRQSSKTVIKPTQRNESFLFKDRQSNEDRRLSRPSRPKLRTITLTCQRRTSKSPPPPIPKKAARSAVPPSPATPRPLQKDTISMATKKAVSATSRAASLARPPRPSRRLPLPLPIAAKDTPSGDCNVEDDTCDYDASLYEGIQWEMLNRRNEQLSSPLLHAGKEQIVGLNKWSAIESWRSNARLSSRVGENIQSAAWERVDPEHKSVGVEADSEKRRTADLRHMEREISGQSLTTMQGFRSISSMGQSSVTALARAMASPSPCSDGRRSLSSPTLDLAAESKADGLLLNNFNPRADAHFPGTFPGLASSQSLSRAGESSSHSIEKASKQHTGMHGRKISSHMRTPSNSAASEQSSDRFESADEGTFGDLSPDLRAKQSRSSVMRQSTQCKAFRRASRMLGVVGEASFEEEAIPRQEQLNLTTAQLVALSEEAVLRQLHPEELRERHEYLLSTEEDIRRGEEFSSDCLPTPELWRNSSTSRSDGVVLTPQSGSWEGGLESVQNGGIGLVVPAENVLCTNKEDFEVVEVAKILASHAPPPLLASPHPVRPMSRHRSKRISVQRAGGDESTMARPSLPAFAKLDKLTVQLVEAPTYSSWRSRVDPHQYKELASTFGSKEMLRQEVIEELSVTETAFVASLNSILRTFSIPLRNSDMSFLKCVPLEVARLFTWLDDILAFHIKLLKSLERIRTSHPSALVVCVALALGKHITGLSIHQSYLINFDRVTKLIEDIRRSEIKGDFAHFDEVLQRQLHLPECRGLGLNSFLLKPVQRLMKYPLFFKQLAELTPWDHLDYLATQQLCSATEKTIRHLNGVKAREEDYLELKSLESRICGLPDDFHLASRQRRLLKQGLIRSLAYKDTERLTDQPPSSTETSPLVQSKGFLDTSPQGHSPCAPCVSDSASQLSASTQIPYFGRGEVSRCSCSDTTTLETRSMSALSAEASTATISSRSLETKRDHSGQKPPPRPASRKQSMTNLFSRSHSFNNGSAKQQHNSGGEEETILHAFVFDDLLLLTTLERDNEREASRTSTGKAFLNKKKGTTSPSFALNAGESARYSVLPKAGVSRILGVTRRPAKGTGATSGGVLEVEVLPLNQTGEGLRAGGSAGSMKLVFSAVDRSSKGAQLGKEPCLLWERALQRSFLSHIQARKRQSVLHQRDMSSPIFGVVHTHRSVAPLSGSLATAQADWPRRRQHVTQKVMNSALCGDRTTLTALLQAGLPFPRSPSQQGLSDLANRTAAMAEETSVGSSNKTVGAVQMPPSQSSASASVKRSPGGVAINVRGIARVGDLGTSSVAARIIDEERREERTWWSLRLLEMEAEAEADDEVDRMMGSRRSRNDGSPSPSEPASGPATRVRRGIPVLKTTNK